MASSVKIRYLCREGLIGHYHCYQQKFLSAECECFSESYKQPISVPAVSIY